jgi:adenine-specific DNA-methyltransferase
MYGAFIEKGVRLLKDTGRLVFVVPTTFMVLDDFSELRKFLANYGRLSVHYLGKVFGHRQVTACVVVLQRGRKGLELWEWDRLSWASDVYDGGLIRFETEETRDFERGKIPLGELFRTHFAARSPEVRKHALTRLEPASGCVPILTGRNLKVGHIDYDNCHSGFWFPQTEAYQLRSFYAFPHIVVGHTKGGRVVAAVDKRCYPWREEIHLIPKRQGIDIGAVIEYLNGCQVGQYMQTLYRDLTPHLTITQLKLLPVPKRLLRGSSSSQGDLFEEADAQ